MSIILKKCVNGSNDKKDDVHEIIQKISSQQELAETVVVLYG